MAMPIEFLFEDEFIFAVNKPSGVHSVAQARSKNASIAERLLELRPELRRAAPKELDAGLINRLDLETSGILLGAKIAEVWQKFFAALKTGEIRKSYSVVLEGNLEQKRIVKGWIGSPHRHGKKVRVYAKEPSREARALYGETSITPVRYDRVNDYTTATVECGAARRHQVRAHCGSIGHPLVGDILYGSSRELPPLSPDLTKRPFYLHAGAAEFTHPVGGHMVSLEAEGK